MIDVSPPSGIPIAPPPWTLQAESWIFLGYHSVSLIKTIKSQPLTRDALSSSVNATFEQAFGLKPGSFHPMENLPETLRVGENSKNGVEKDVFKGGLCGWILYRYSESPVGSYDELIYVAGAFDSPASKTSGLRITNIVVSSEASVWNGRRNWNIPKHLASFKWSHPVHSTSKEIQTVEIFHPSNSPLSSSKPYFSATLSQSSLPSLPINTNRFFFPSLPLPQWDLHRSSGYDAKGSERLAEIGIQTEEGIYRSTAPTFKGKCGLAYCGPNLERDGNEEKTYGDGVGFVEDGATWGWGVHFREVEVGFPLSEESSRVGDKKTA